jgi:hypothetical protein
MEGGIATAYALDAVQARGRMFIEPGEEINFDYAMCDGTPYDEFECECGCENCRGRITGSDWARPELWEKYDGYFMPYLARRIEALKAKIRVPAWVTTRNKVSA